MVGDGGLEGFRCLAVEGARVGPDSGGGGRPGVGFGRGGGRLEGVTGEGGSVQPFVQGGAHVCPPVRPPPFSFSGRPVPQSLQLLQTKMQGRLNGS